MNYHIIKKDDMVNGEGLRVVVFLSGCESFCRHCHNKETWDADSGKKFDEDAVDEIMNELCKDYISGITLTGGDPLYWENVNGVYGLVADIKRKFPDKTIWMYTGCTWGQIFHPVVTNDFNPVRSELLEKRKNTVGLCDVLVDGKFVQELADVNYPWAGSTNQRIIDCKKSLQQNKVVLYK